ncbi:Hint domain-containing protein [Falsiphaeobacter marinintestinus]|uniref:Hint domain-containing protein n=1 Tax=Falsiphaeobacter marinintestinus TaxID=1492905 RepID=UPI0011B7516D|nr:Hint domain-containing protein [Phaeobacter marinintestinus]
MADPYVSEVKYLGGASLDFIEIAVDAGTDVSSIVVTVYNANGSVRTTNTLEFLASTEFGKDIYVINTVESSTFNGLNKRGAVSLSDDTTVYQFISFDDGAPVTANSGPADTMTSDQIGQAGGGESLLSTDGGASYVVQSPPTPGTIPCFVAGTRIATPDGAVSVELLKPGALVCDAQGGVLRVLQVLHRRVSAADVITHPTMRPVRISAGALGHGTPERDLLVSRQHRVAVRSPVVERMFGCSESLVAAARLLELDGVDLIREPKRLTYCHLLLERHGLVLAEGAPCESFLIAPVSVDAVSDQARDRIVSFFPQAMMPGFRAQTCAHIPGNRQQKRLIWRHLKNDKPLISNVSAKVTG